MKIHRDGSNQINIKEVTGDGRLFRRIESTVGNCAFCCFKRHGFKTFYLM